MYVTRIEKLLCAYSPVPLCILNPQGKVARASDKIDEVFIYDGIQGADVFTLTGIKYLDIREATGEGRPLILSRNEKVFKILTSFIGEGELASIVMYFFDVTDYETIKEQRRQERCCMAVVNVDNFDELTSSTGEDAQMLLATEIDKVVRSWGAKMDASVTHYKDHLYLMIFAYKHYEKMVETKFPVLDEIRQLETESDFPVTLSIGIGVGGESLLQTDQFATDALDIALGRGGDQGSC